MASAVPFQPGAGASLASERAMRCLRAAFAVSFAALGVKLALARA